MRFFEGGAGLVEFVDNLQQTADALRRLPVQFVLVLLVVDYQAALRLVQRSEDFLVQDPECYGRYISESFLSMTSCVRESFLAMYSISTRVQESMILNRFFSRRLSQRSLVWLLTTSSPSISVLNSTNTRLRETIDAPKWDSATALMDWMWESAENLRPNLPLRRDWKSSLLLLITLHMSMYLKQRTARLSLAAMRGSRASQKQEQEVLQSWSWAQRIPDMRSISAMIPGWQQTLLAFALEAVREAFALAQFFTRQLILLSRRQSSTSSSLSSALRTSIRMGSMIFMALSGSPTSRQRPASLTSIRCFRQVLFSDTHQSISQRLSSICSFCELGIFAMQSTSPLVILASLGLEKTPSLWAQFSAISLIFSGVARSTQSWASPVMADSLARTLASVASISSPISVLRSSSLPCLMATATLSQYDIFKNNSNIILFGLQWLIRQWLWGFKRAQPRLNIGGNRWNYRKSGLVGGMIINVRGLWEQSTEKLQFFRLPFSQSLLFRLIIDIESHVQNLQCGKTAVDHINAVLSQSIGHHIQMGEFLQIQQRTYTLVCHLVGRQVQVKQVHEHTNLTYAYVCNGVLGNGQFLQAEQSAQILQAAVSQVVVADIQDLQVLKVGDACECVSCEVVAVELQFDHFGEIAHDGGDARVADFVLAQHQGLEAFEGLQLDDVLVGNALVGQVDLFGLFGDRCVLDGDQSH